MKAILNAHGIKDVDKVSSCLKAGILVNLTIIIIIVYCTAAIYVIFLMNLASYQLGC